MHKALGLTVFSLTVVASLMGAASASAQAAFASPSGGGGGFGAPGQFVITGDFEGHLRKGWELRLHPSLDYFIAPNISVGALVGLTYDSGTPSTTTIDLGVRAGYNLPIVDRVNFWPKVGIVFSNRRTSSTATMPSNSSSSTALQIAAPFLYQLVPHLFVGAGPYFILPLDNSGNSYGVETVVGGWF